MPYLTNCPIVYTCALTGDQGAIHPIAHGTVAWRGDTIEWVGPLAELPATYRGEKEVDCGGGFALPGLIDCHTHLAFAGWRADEFVERVRGKTYLEIAERGGGILSTVAQTRAATKRELLARCRDFIGKISALGVTTIECKSGYGLDLETELKILEVYREIESSRVSVVPTFLGAHTVPKEYRERREEYVSLVIESMVPAVVDRNLAVFCDIFVEKSAFSVAEARRIFAAAKKGGLRPKLHADQLTAGGGAELAAEVGAVSADHLECTTDAGRRALAEANVVAVMLPFASLYTREKPADARPFVEAGVRVAVATDFNPGSAPSYHLPLGLSLSCTMNGLTPSEAVKGATSIAACALGLEGTHGALQSGKKADIAIFRARDVDSWLYHIEANVCSRVIKNGVELG